MFFFGFCRAWHSLTLCNTRRNTEDNTTAPPSPARRCTLRLRVKLLRTYHWSWSFTWAGGGKRIKKVFCGKKNKGSIDIYWYDLAFTAWHITKPATIAFWKYCGFCCDWSGLPALVPKMQEIHGPPRRLWERHEPFDFFFWGSSWLWKCSIHIIYKFSGRAWQFFVWYFCLFNHVHELRVA